MIKPLLIAAACLAVAGCACNKNVVIVSTNDMHSAIDAFPSLATVVGEQRAANRGRVVLVDAGDRWTGNPYVDRAPEKYKPVIELMNELDYDLATFGNHEWDGGEPLLAERSADARFAKVLANFELGTFGVKDVKPYKIVRAGGLNIAFLGLVTTDDNGHPVGMAENFGKTAFLDPYQTAEGYRWLRDEADVLVGLTHIGFEEDSLLAVQRPELDLIIGGHSHTVVPEGRRIGNAVVTQAGRNLAYAGITTISCSKGKVKSIENHLVKLDTVPENPRFRALVNRYYNEPELLKIAGAVDGALNKTGLLNLFSDILREETDADFAFYNAGGMRINALDAGDITRADVYKAEPFDNKPVVVEMTMSDIRAFIINKFNSTGKEAHSVDLYPSGIGYIVVRDANGDAVNVVFDRMIVPDMGRKFRVAMSDYVNGAYDFPQRGQGVPAGGTIADKVLDYLSGNSPVKADNTPRVKIE